MAKLQCKMCGGMVELAEGTSVAECPYCGSTTTFPKATDERVERLYARAEHFRQVSEFDKAVAAYEEIVRDNPDDAEAYWGLVLSRFGIEYVEDPVSHERVPTCHRVQYDSILADADYLVALEKAGAAEHDVYETEAKRIAEIQKGILAISAQEKPFDVFICYKETTEGGSRTKDSVTAQEIYYQLTNQGYKVFFARITLEGKLGQQYEPYIFAALNSAKVMLVIGSRREYFNAVWVRNEWSRFLALMKQDHARLLIPCYCDMDAYDLPDELSMLQSQDMSKIGFIQDLLHGIQKVVPNEKTSGGAASAKTAVSSEVAPLLKRIRLFLDAQDFEQARAYCDRVLDRVPENAEAYLLRLMAEKRVCNEEKLCAISDWLGTLHSFKLAMKFADASMKSRLEALAKAQMDERKLGELKTKFKSASTREDYQKLATRFAELGESGEAEEYRRKCEEWVREFEAAAAATYRKKCDEALRMQDTDAAPEAWESLAQEFDGMRKEVPKAADAATQCREMAWQIRYAEYQRKCDEAKRMQVTEVGGEALEALALDFEKMKEKIPEATEMAHQLRYGYAQRLKADRRYGEAVEWFKRLPDGYSDAADLVQKCYTLEWRSRIKWIGLVAAAVFALLLVVFIICNVVQSIKIRELMSEAEMAERQGDWQKMENVASGALADFSRKDADAVRVRADKLHIRKLLDEADVAERQGDWQTMERLADELLTLSTADSDAVQRRADKLNGGLTLTLSGKERLRMKHIPKGTFMMGSPTAEAGRHDDEGRHRVTISREFWLGETEVTQAQWEAVMGGTPSHFKGDNLPVEQVSWDDAKRFCGRLNGNSSIRRPEGYRFDLPTEAQWEFAARGGVKSRNTINSGGNDVSRVAWYSGNSGGKTHPVRGKEPNELGLYDMSGNVWEWCRDWYGSYGRYNTDPKGPSSGLTRVNRGGSWRGDVRGCRAALRNDDSPGARGYNLGFRLALVRDQ